MIRFFVDENLPIRLVTNLLRPRGHQAIPVQVGVKDPVIIVTANEESAVVLTADRWFLKELYRYPPGHKRYLASAGVVQLPGAWDVTEQRLREYLPIIEATYTLRQSQGDRRMGIDLSSRSVKILASEERVS